MPFGINDPSALLRPFRNLQQFTEELFAMYSKSGDGSAAESQKGVSKAVGVETTPGSKKKDSGSDRNPLDINATRKARLEAARPAPAIIEPRNVDPHAAGKRAPQPAQEEASRTRQQPVPAAPETKAAPGIARPKATYATTVIDQRRRPAAAAGDEHAATRRVSDQTDHSSPAVLAGAGFTPKAREASAAKAGRNDVESTPQRRERQAHAASKSQESKPAEDFGPNAAESTNRDYGTFQPVPVLDIGNFATPPGGGSSAATVFMGKVVSGSGATYQVTLYSNGPTQAGDTPDVTVTIPMIDHTDTINAGTWLNGIFQFTAADGTTTYSCQPPVWMS